MAAAQPNTNRRKEVEFPPNVPVTVALAYPEPRRVPSMSGGERCMFTTTANEIMFLSPEVAGKITELGINVRVPFTITKRQGAGKNAPVEWEVARIAGEQGDGTFAAPKLPEAAGPKPMARAATAAPSLFDESIALVDTFAEAWKYARDKYQGAVKPEEVKALVITAYIQRGKHAA